MDYIRNVVGALFVHHNQGKFSTHLPYNLLNSLNKLGKGINTTLQQRIILGKERDGKK